METFLAFLLGFASSVLATWAYETGRDAIKTGRIEAPSNNSEVDRIQKEDLMADWELASNGEAVFKIEPLK